MLPWSAQMFSPILYMLASAWLNEYLIFASRVLDLIRSTWLAKVNSCRETFLRDTTAISKLVSYNENYVFTSKIYYVIEIIHQFRNCNRQVIHMWTSLWSVSFRDRKKESFLRRFNDLWYKYQKTWKTCWKPPANGFPLDEVVVETGNRLSPWSFHDSNMLTLIKLHNAV